LKALELNPLTISNRSLTSIIWPTPIEWHSMWWKVVWLLLRVLLERRTLVWMHVALIET
jgi:hypothetical protein